MRSKRLIWQIYPAILVPCGVLLVAVMWFASRSIREFYLDETARDLEARAKLVRNQVAPLVAEGDEAAIDSLCEFLGRPTRTRITVILASGVVVGDSDEDPATMENHSDRPEFIGARAGRIGRSIHFSRTLREKMMYVAVPGSAEAPVIAVVRVAVSLRSVEEALGGIYGDIAAGLLVLAAVAVLASFLLSRRIARPLQQLSVGAERYATGDFRAPLPATNSEEIGALVNSLNKMATSLDGRLAKVVQQRNELETVLASMVEGVLAVDTGERVISLNHAAAELFDIDASKAPGRPLQELFRNPEIQRLAAGALESETPLEAEITLYGVEERVLQAHATVLRDARGAKIGVLLVMYDITRLRRLERVRRDFVANVSHELRTPVTTIKGFVETLLGGAIHEQQDAGRFLRIIAKQVERLDSIIEDLLSLSRLEQDTDRSEVMLEKRRVSDVVCSAVEVCRPMARPRNIEIRAEAGEPVECNLNARLLEQAIVNLIDNAIKYSEPGSPVDVTLRVAGSEAVISVEDRGCGIERRHLPRLFERFYRTDRARSRELGGTGLGLAIVKHIAIVHGGRVGVESEPGTGSVFSIFLPVGGRNQSLTDSAR
jgi:two-component system phosphate regulon sensor histidine kinase PhoR